MVHALAIWLPVAAFAGAGAFNAIGTAATRRNFVRWGYPPWWCHVTGALEIAIAALLAFLPSREAGLIAGAVVIAAATATVLRHRDFSHLVPLGAVVALLVVDAWVI